MSASTMRKCRKPYGKFALQSFKNPSGDQIYRISGTINGRRIRRNFKTKDKAVAAKQDLELQRKAEENFEKVVITSLTRAQCEEAKIAFNLLEGRKKPLSFYIRYALERYREAEYEMPVAEALQEYLDHKDWQCGRGIITGVQFRIIKGQLENFAADFSKSFLGEINSDSIKEWLSGQEIGLKTWNNKRAYLNTFFRFCISKEWLAINPIDKVDQHTIKAKRGSAPTISTEEAAALMHFLEGFDGGKNSKHPKGFTVPYFALCLFAGLRPDIRTGEVGRLRNEDVRLDTNVILVEPEVSKVDEKRSVKIQPNLRLWLEKYPLEEFPIIPSGIEFYRRRIRKEFKLGHDILRHTYISMMVGSFRSIGDAALQAGNSEAIIREHYLDLKTEAEADAFWSIVPIGTRLNESFKKEDGRFLH